MKIVSGLILLFALIVSSYSNAQTSKTEQRFNQLIDSILSVYGPLIISQTGDRLDIDKKWDSVHDSANANKLFGIRSLQFHGGLFRHELVTEDSFSLMICHEVGHHLGGSPFYADDRQLSLEGQADYFATSVCLKRIWQNQDNIGAIQKLSVPETLHELCNRQSASPSDRALCKRISLAAFAALEYLRSEALLRGEKAPPVSFNTPAHQAAGGTETYPSHQCRLDTSLAGALNQERPQCWFKN